MTFSVDFMSQSNSPPNSSGNPLDILRVTGSSSDPTPEQANPDEAKSAAPNLDGVQDLTTGSDSDPESTQAEEYKAQARERGEFGGPKGPEPTRYGDWERKGRCVDF